MAAAPGRVRGQSASTLRPQRPTQRPGYSMGHNRVRKLRGNPLHCERCGKTGGTTRNYNWASRTGNYSDPADYVRVCIPCHRKMDDPDGTVHAATVEARRQQQRHGITPYEDREWLRSRYVDRGMTTFEIADEAQCNQRTIWSWLRRHDIPARKPGRRPNGT